ncbi:MAG: amidohydrolase family protein, partial [Alphaproteobacteria bacterium]
GYSSAMHYFDQAGRRQTHWDEAQGMKDLERAVEFASAWDGKYEGRVRAILVPWEVHLSSAELLQKTKSAARELGVGITLHVAESMLEFQDIVRGTGRTPVGWLADLGILGPEVILGHCLYLGGHSQTAYPFAGDLDAIAGSGASVAHCPLVFGRRGVTLESFQRYLDHGVNMSTGTDSYPQDLLGELKFVSVLSKVADRSFESANARDVFNAATLGGAKALRRPDLGRLAPGAKADIVIVDFERPRIGPFLDPIKALIHCADGDAIERVIVAGKTLVEGGRLIVWDERELLESVRRSTARAWGRFPEYYALNQPIDEAFPPAFKRWTG